MRRIEGFRSHAILSDSCYGFYEIETNGVRHISRLVFHRNTKLIILKAINAVLFITLVLTPYTSAQITPLGSQTRSGVLRTMMSSAPGVYNRSAEGQVPLPRLVTELKEHSSLKSTVGKKSKDGPLIIEF